MNPAVFTPLQITACRMLSADVLHLRLQRADGAELPAFSAGAHIEVQITDDLRRAYSLCSDPAERHYYEIAVRLEQEGRGGSRALHLKARPGVELAVSEPRNLFGLAENAPHHLLVGGGVGLTPLIAMAHALSARQQPFTLLVASPSRGAGPFDAQLQASGWPLQACRAPRENLDVQGLLQTLPAGTHVYCCGPAGLMDRVRQQCAGLPAEQWHEEAFAGSETVVETAFELYLSESDLTLQVAEGSSILHTLRSAGINVDSACEQGICGSCVVAWRDGEPVHGDQCLDDDERAEYLAVCCGGCNSKRLTLEL